MRPALFSAQFEMMEDELLRPRVIKTGCICILAILLIAGLWPFHVPKNQVRWLTSGDGLYFGSHGMILSTSSFPSQPDNASGSMELWLEPRLLRGAHTVLSFDGSAHLGVPFALRQINDDLIVEQDNEDINSNSWTAWSVVRGAFHAERPVFVSIVLKPRHTVVYLDGLLYRDFTIGDSWNNFSGQLVVATSPFGGNSWSGTIRGMAIYNRQLSSGEISEHYRSWTKSDRPSLSNESAPIALYLFNERAGELVHNEFDRGTDLRIPTRYFVLHPPFLESPLRSYHSTWSYWKDVTVNLLGFVPFGLFATAYFSSVRHVKRAGLIALSLGFLVSLLIEIFQSFLPTRNSGVNDLITNTLGTEGGVILYFYIGRRIRPVVRPSKATKKYSPRGKSGEQDSISEAIGHA